MKNHYIPKYYSGQWADSATRKLWCYSRPYKKVVVKQKLPVSVGVKNDIYTIPHIGDDVRYILEEVFFKKIDQEGSDVLTKLRNGNYLTSQDRLSWAITVVALRQRHPIKLKELAADMANQLNHELKAAEEEYYRRRGTDDKATFKQYMIRERTSERVEQLKITAIRDIILLPNTLRWIANADWSIISPKDRSHTFLTSDRPVIMSDGLAVQGGHIALPIGPTKLWLAAGKSVHEQISQLPNLARSVNDLIVRQAIAQVFGADDRHIAFVENRLGLDSRNAVAD